MYFDPSHPLFSLRLAIVAGVLIASPVPASAALYSCSGADNSVALNGLLSAGGDIEVAAGVCPLAHTIYVTVNGTRLHGSGMGRTVFTSASPLGFNMIQVGIFSGRYHGTGFDLSNFSIDGRQTAPADLSSRLGVDLVVAAGVTNASITQIEAYRGLSGIALGGSWNLVSNVWAHDNRRAGIYVAGDAKLAQPYADHDIVANSYIENNTLDNMPGKTWDDLDFDVLSRNGVITNNKVVGGDILVSDSVTPGGIGGFFITNNTVLRSDIINSAFSGIRLYGNIHRAYVAGNFLDANKLTGISVVGNVTDVVIDNNTIVAGGAYGIHVFPLVADGNSVGDRIDISHNTITMTNDSRPAVSVLGAANVALEYNVVNGAWYDLAHAGAQLLNIGNR